MKLKSKIKFINFIIILLLFISSCGYYYLKKVNYIINKSGVMEESTQNEVYEEKKQKGELDINLKYDYSYKIFYGEWEIVDIIGYDHHLGKSFDEAEEMIGTKISYSKDNIYTNELKIETFDYSYTINPNVKNQCYYNYTLTNEQLGITGDYYVFVHVETL